jgi:hypothetical protein
MRRLGAAATLAGLVVFGACGGGHGKASLSSGYVKRANALCDQWTKALMELGTSPPLGDTGRMATFTKQQVAIDQGFTDRFTSLPATDSERKTLAPVFASFNTINGGEASVLDSAQRGDRAGIQTYHQTVVDETDRVNVKLKALHLTSCAG